MIQQFIELSQSVVLDFACFVPKCHHECSVLFARFIIGAFLLDSLYTDKLEKSHQNTEFTIATRGKKCGDHTAKMLHIYFKPARCHF